jgi:hypothetical protein
VILVILAILAQFEEEPAKEGSVCVFSSRGPPSLCLYSGERYAMLSRGRWRNKGMKTMAEPYEVNTTAYQAKGREQFAQQTGILDGPRMLSISMVRKPILAARLVSLGKKNLPRPANERQYAVDCALRAYTHFNPQHGYCAKTECLRCKQEISDTSNISIVMLALPPWNRKSKTVKTAMMSGFFCAACDVLDDEAKTIWAAAVKEQGVEIALTNEGRA